MELSTSRKVKISTIIIDDESKPSKLISDLLIAYCPEIGPIEICNSVQDGLAKMNQNTYDLLFLDVEMPGMNGFEFLDSLPKDLKSQVIFTTAHEKYAVNAFKANAIDYLVKPIHPKDLIQSVKKVIDRLSQNKTNPSQKISLYDGKQYHLLDIDELIRVEADGSYCHFILKDGNKLHSSKRLKTYEALLETQNFFRSHKSHMVNLRFIKSYTFSDGGLIYLSNGESIPFSASKKSNFIDSLNISYV